MAAEEDKKFHAVLGGFLINDLRGRADHIHCPESDVLAAYHERSLLPEEMNLWKEHIVGCARCQAILSELEATDSIPLQVAEKEEVLRAAAAAPAAVVSQGRTVAPAKEKLRAFRLSRGVRWQWLAPAGAVAAGLLVWVAWHENQPPQVQVPAETKVARMESPVASAPQPPATQQVPTSSSLEQAQDQGARFSKDQAAIGRTVSAKKEAEEKSLKQLKESESRATATLAEPSVADKFKQLEKPAPSADKERVRLEETGRDLAAANRAQNQPAQDAKAAAVGGLSQTVEVQTQTASAPIQNEQTQQAAQNQLNAQKLPAPSPVGQAEETAKAKSKSTHALRALESAPPAAPAAMQLAAVYNPHLIPVPHTKILWRVGRAGLIEFSRDAGASWLQQTSKVFVDLTAGSAPSDKVCWIVGRAGTILLTTDAGAHWATVHSPLDEDLGGVRATDAVHATIWNLGNTKVFETSDGGATWKPPASQ
ncbi:MAG TPA: hypothetical protein VI431_11965 [Candidatus Acidoferrum sp.]